MTLSVESDLLISSTRWLLSEQFKLTPRTINSNPFRNYEENHEKSIQVGS